MNNQNLPNKAAANIEIPAKRKRGRPRKDDNVEKRVRPQGPITPAPPAASEQVRVANPIIPRIDHHNNTLQVGQIVSGVVEGSFDAGYFIAVRAGQSNTILRGVVFKPGCVVPVTAANDIAPHVQMYQREELGLPVANLQNPATSPVLQQVQHVKQPAQLVGHSVVPMAVNPVPFGQQHFRPSFLMIPPVMQNRETGTSLQGGQIAAQKNLKMVEQDEVMQVFEVLKPSDGPTIDFGAAGDNNLDVNQGSEIQKTVLESQIETSSKVGGDQVKNPDRAFQETPSLTTSESPYQESQGLESVMKQGGLVRNDSDCTNLGARDVSIACEPQSSELVHHEMKNPNYDPEEAISDGTPHSVDCRPKSDELIQHDISSANLEVLPLEEGTSMSLHAEIDDPISSKVNDQTESEVHIPTKYGTSCSELAVEKSEFQESSIEHQAYTSAAQPTHCPPDNASETGK